MRSIRSTALGLVLLLFLTGCSSSKFSVRPYVGKRGVVKQSALRSSLLYHLPTTAIDLRFTVVRSSYAVGPYAQFSQRYLGVDPVTEPGVIYTILGVSAQTVLQPDLTTLYLVTPSKPKVQTMLENAQKSGYLYWQSSSKEAYSPLGTPSERESALESGALQDGMGANVDPNLMVTAPRIKREISTFYTVVQQDSQFVSVPVRRETTQQQSDEEMAQGMAEQIFALRARERELLEGETEHPYDLQTLSFMLKGLRTLERQTTALFEGAIQHDTLVFNVRVTPQIGDEAVVPCRFSSELGLRPVEDLRADPLILSFTIPEGLASVNQLLATDPAPSGYLVQRAPIPVECTLFLGHDLLMKSQLQLMQYGTLRLYPIAP